MLRIVVALALCTVGCGGEEGLDDGFTAAEWAVIRTLSPLPALPANPTNRFADDPAAARLGQRLFFEKSYSGPLVTGDDGTNGGLGAVGERGQVSCASCHIPSAWFQDTRSRPNGTSLAVDWGPRNTTTLVNVAFYRFFGWAGRSDSLWMDATLPPENPVQHASSRLAVVHMLWDKYRADYDAIFDPDLDPRLDPAHPDAAAFPAEGKPGDPAWDAMAAADQAIVNRIYANFGKAIEAYERLLVSRNAPFDRYVAGDRSALAASAKRGLRLFIGKAACVGCHSTAFFTDNGFHNDGVAQTGEHVPAMDAGRFDTVARLMSSPFNSSGAFSDDTTTGRLDGLAPSDANAGRFRTKHLRQIGELGPYMHTGQLATLADVMTFYDLAGSPEGFAGTRDPLIVPLNLSPEERNDLATFLDQGLTGEPISAMLMLDTSAP